MLQAVREAAAQGLSSEEATVLFTAALKRMQDANRDPDKKDD